MPRKGYVPKSSRKKLSLSVEKQRELIGKAAGKRKLLIVLMLSTGMHPMVLGKDCNLVWDESQYAFNRPKTKREIMGAWSRAMKEQNLSQLRALRRTRQSLWQMVRDEGRKVGLPGLCPVQLRHTYFVNRARLRHDAFSIAESAGTDLHTVYKYYTVGISESKALPDQDREFLAWLMEC